MLACLLNEFDYLSERRLYLGYRRGLGDISFGFADGGLARHDYPLMAAGSAAIQLIILSNSLFTLASKSASI